MKKRIDVSVFERFVFEYQPVGVKFLLTKPQGIAPLDRNMAFCEMLKTAQSSDPFYATQAHQECKAASVLLGMVEPDPVFESGQMGPKLGVFDDARANRRLYRHAPQLARDSVNYVAFAPLDKLDFDPDLLIVTARPGQAEIVLRAMSYKTGAGWNAKGSTVMGCAWLYTYPYVTGELNLMVTGLHHGMKARNLFPEGLLFLSIPFDLLPGIVESLHEMQWDLPQYSWGKEVHMQKMKEIAESVRQELQQ